jgi:predicted kinase
VASRSECSFPNAGPAIANSAASVGGLGPTKKSLTEVKGSGGLTRNERVQPALAWSIRGARGPYRPAQDWDLFERPGSRRYIRAMNGVEVLVLHGSPGSGKTTLSRAIAELLRAADRAHAVIDLDDLSKIYPDPGRSFARDNLKAIWPNYAAIPQLKVVIPSVIADEQERVQLRTAVSGARFIVCELTAPEAVLKNRVTAREPNDYWQQRLRDFVDLYRQRTDLPQIRDFRVETHGRSTHDAAREVVEKAGWS